MLVRARCIIGCAIAVGVAFGSGGPAVAATALAAGVAGSVLSGAGSGMTAGRDGGVPLRVAAGRPSLAGAGSVGPPLPSSSTVTVITGDRVRLDVLPDGQQSANVLPASGHGVEAASSAFVEFTWDSDVYVVP